MHWFESPYPANRRLQQDPAAPRSRLIDVRKEEGFTFPGDARELASAASTSPILIRDGEVAWNAATLAHFFRMEKPVDRWLVLQKVQTHRAKSPSSRRSFEEGE